MNSVPTITLNNSLTIPQLGLGVWRASDDDAETAVTTALQSGYRLIDTAMIYGNETGVGRGIREAGVPREELFITTKLWNSDQGYESTLAAFEASRQKLGLDYLDLYLIHWPMPEHDTMLESWRAMEELYASGKVKAIGVCNFRVADLEKLLQNSTVAPAVNQVELHPDFAQSELREFCTHHHIAVESWSPIGGSGNQILSDPLVVELSEHYGKSPAQIALRWHIQSGLVVIPKSVHAERIRENIAVFDFELSDDDMARLARLDDLSHRLGPDPATMNSH